MQDDKPDRVRYFAKFVSRDGLSKIEKVERIYPRFYRAVVNGSNPTYASEADLILDLGPGIYYRVYELKHGVSQLKPGIFKATYMEK